MGNCVQALVVLLDDSMLFVSHGRFNRIGSETHNHRLCYSMMGLIICNHVLALWVIPIIVMERGPFISIDNADR
jgi:hypothetical protein